MIDNATEVETSAFPPSMGSQVFWCGSVVAVSIIALLWGGDFLQTVLVSLSFRVFVENQKDGMVIMRIFGYLCVAFYAIGIFMVIRSFRDSMRIHADSFDKIIFIFSLAFVFSAARVLNTFL